MTKTAATSAPNTRGGRAKTIAMRLSVLAIALFVALLLAELVVRFTSPQYPSWLDIFSRDGDFPVYHFQPNVSRTINTGETNWTVYTDAQGFRCAKSPRVNPEAPVLLVLGDSFAFGMGVDYEQTFAGIIQSRIGDKYRVLNTSVLGYGPTQYRQVLEYELAHGLNPKMVLVATYMGNDFHDCIWGKAAPVKNGILGNEESARSVLKRNSHLYRLVSRAVHILHEKTTTAPPHETQLYQPAQWQSGDLAKAYAIYRKEFATIAGLCHAHKIPVMACIIPTNLSVAHAGDANYDLPVAKAQAAMTECGIPFVSVTSALAAEGARRCYFSWDMHLSAIGNQKTAETILAHWPAITTATQPSQANGHESG